MKYFINGQVFSSLDKIKNHVRNIVKKYKDHENLKDEDFNFMSDLFKRHELYEEKKGSGIKNIFINTTKPYGSRCFFIERSDGSQTDISFTMCLRNNKESDFQRFMAAGRTAIKQDISTFRKTAGNICSVSGKELRVDDIDVDYAAPWTFQKICKVFFDEKQLEGKEAVLYKCDGRVENEIKDEFLRQAFIDFHNEKASLRVVHKELNRGFLKRK